MAELIMNKESQQIFFLFFFFNQGHPERLQEHGRPGQSHGEECPLCPLR